MSDPEARSQKTSELPSEITSTPSNPNPGCRYYGHHGEVLSRHPRDISPAELPTVPEGAVLPPQDSPPAQLPRSIQDGVGELVQGDQRHQKCDETRQAVTAALNSTIEGQHNTIVDQVNTINRLHSQILDYHHQITGYHQQISGYHQQISSYQETIRAERQSFETRLRKEVTAAVTAPTSTNLSSPRYGPEYIIATVRNYAVAEGLWPSTTSVNATGGVPGQNRSSEAPVWEPRPDQKPTRVFGEEFKQKAADAMGESKSTGQTAKQAGMTSAGDIGDSTLRGRPRQRHSIPGHLISKNYDSIPLKPEGLGTDEDRRLPDLQGNSGSTSKGEVKKTPLETPGTSREPMKQSKETSPRLSEVPSLDEDIPLKGQLVLTNSPENEQNKDFLGQVGKKLSQATLMESAGNMISPPLSSPTGDPSKTNQSNVDPALKNVDGNLCETPEEDPPLRFKKPRNFDSALGKGEEVDYGRGFAKKNKKDPDISAA